MRRAVPGIATQERPRRVSRGDESDAPHRDAHRARVRRFKRKRRVSFGRRATREPRKKFRRRETFGVPVASRRGARGRADAPVPGGSVGERRSRAREHLRRHGVLRVPDVLEDGRERPGEPKASRRRVPGRSDDPRRAARRRPRERRGGRNVGVVSKRRARVSSSDERRRTGKERKRFVARRAVARRPAGGSRVRRRPETHRGAVQSRLERRRIPGASVPHRGYHQARLRPRSGLGRARGRAGEDPRPTRRAGRDRVRDARVLDGRLERRRRDGHREKKRRRRLGRRARRVGGGARRRDEDEESGRKRRV